MADMNNNNNNNNNKFNKNMKPRFKIPTFAQGGGDREDVSPNPILQQQLAVDTSNMGRGVWIVKVPNYVAEAWQRAPSDMTVAKLSIEQTDDGERTLNINMTDDCVALAGPTLPRRHHLQVKEMTGQNVAIMTQTFKTDELNESNMSVEGFVAQKLECRPQCDKSYINMKIDSFKKAETPNRIAKQLSQVVNNYKPVSDHQHNIEMREKQKEEGRRYRADKDKVISMLIDAFQKHEFYALKDLVGLTRQPVTYLKGILSEIANFCTKIPHKNMWHLKPEYQLVATKPEGTRPIKDNVF